MLYKTAYTEVQVEVLKAALEECFPECAQLLYEQLSEMDTDGCTPHEKIKALVHAAGDAVKASL